MSTIEELTAAVAEAQATLDAAIAAVAPQQADVDAAQGALSALLPTQYEYDLAGLRPDTNAQDAAFGADAAAVLRTSLAAKEAASPARRLDLTRAQRALAAASDAVGLTQAQNALAAAQAELQTSIDAQDSQP